MAPNDIEPGFVQIAYQSAYGRHVATIPTVPILSGVAYASGKGFQLRGAASPVDVDVAIRDYLTLAKVFWAPTTTFLEYTLFTKAAGSPAQPVLSNTLGIVATGLKGTNTDKATQSTWTFRTEEFGIFKLVFLDAVAPQDFNKLVALGVGGPHAALRDYVTSTNSWMSGRDDGRPTTFLQIAYTLNEKLRRSYGTN